VKPLIRIVFLLVLGFGAQPLLALNPGDRVDNFQLLDQNGESHELYYLSDMKAVVVMIHGNGCPIVRNALPTLNEIRNAYAIGISLGMGATYRIVELWRA